MPDEQIRQAVQNIIGPQIPLHDNSQTFTAVRAGLAKLDSDISGKAAL